MTDKKPFWDAMKRFAQAHVDLDAPLRVGERLPLAVTVYGAWTDPEPSSWPGVPAATTTATNLGDDDDDDDASDLSDNELVAEVCRRLIEGDDIGPGLRAMLRLALDRAEGTQNP